LEQCVIFISYMCTAAVISRVLRYIVVTAGFIVRWRVQMLVVVLGSFYCVVHVYVFLVLIFKMHCIFLFRCLFVAFVKSK
jgi:hypothetical protein